MQKFQAFSVHYPYLFGLVLLVLYALLTTLTFPVHFLFPDTTIGQLLGDALSKLIAFLFFLFLLWRFGWLQASGITRIGSPRTWLIFAVLLMYSLATHLYAFTGSITLPVSDRPLALASLVMSLSTSLVEETMVRGLVLVAMLTAWGETKPGQIRAILFSASLFGLIHLLNLMIRPPGVVLFQAMVIMLSGIFYAAFVLYSRTLWTMIILHWLGNAVVNIKVIGYANYQEHPMMWVTWAVLLVPLLAYSAYLIRDLPPSSVRSAAVYG